ncbi:MAG: hypothetical protein A2X08_14405 [Bacteroidetes bacterium GWA2_32_17]|nr:MAG: hypothetical protein A2X08_14405 [Bacteroidetes bacterium GWA2_32_17]
MKSKLVKFIRPFTIIVIFVMFIAGCKKDNNTVTVAPVNNTITDIDGNVYHYVTIGTQVWLVEDLKVTHYRNGDSIPNITDETQWTNLTSGAYCNYDNNVLNSTTYGKLYNWYVINDSRNICPTGWHVPTDAEWTTLVTFLGGEGITGGKLKETGTIHWLSPNTGATNETGFTALPAGTRNSSGSYSNTFNHGYWWTSSEQDASNAWDRNVNYNHVDIYRNYDPKTTGFSIRCIKD